MTKVSRYSASGMTQRKGTEATSSERWDVRPNMRLDGTAESISQKTRVRQSGAAMGMLLSTAGIVGADGAVRQTNAPTPVINTQKARNVMVHTNVCTCRANNG